MGEGIGQGRGRRKDNQYPKDICEVQKCNEEDAVVGGQTQSDTSFTPSASSGVSLAFWCDGSSIFGSPHPAIPRSAPNTQPRRLSRLSQLIERKNPRKQETPNSRKNEVMDRPLAVSRLALPGKRFVL